MNTSLNLFLNYLLFYYRNEKYGGTKNDHLIFNKQKDSRLCHELNKENTLNSSPSSESQGRFQVEIKTGNTIRLYV